jgi:Mn-dependent DtxR family transcriptional regulator
VRASQRVQKAEDQLAAAREAFYAEIQASRAAGVTLSAISRALGVSRQRVQQIIERLERE